MRMLPFALLLLAACSGGDKTDDTSGIVGDATAGADVYASSCAGCHGADGEGVTGPAMADAVSGKDDAALEDIILNGTGSMPAVTLAEQDVADVIAYVQDTFGG